MLAYPEALVRAQLIKRYKRFLADVILPDGTQAIAHCGNPGSMTGLTTPGSAVYLSANRNPSAKLDWRWEIASQPINGANQFVGINTTLANRVVEAAIQAGEIKPLSGYETCRREVKYGSRNSRIDFLLEDPERPPCYVEVKSVTLRRPDGPNPDGAEFPDAKTARGAKHLAELSDSIGSGNRAVMLYLAQRADCTHFSLARDIDPSYAMAFERAKAAGVESYCFDCVVSPEGIQLKSALPVRV